MPTWTQLLSIAMFVNKRLSSKDLINYIAAQVVELQFSHLQQYSPLVKFQVCQQLVLVENASSEGVTPFGGFLFEVIASLSILVIMTVTSSF